MDSESFHIINLFQQGSYNAAISAYTVISSPSPLLSLYCARSHLALTPPAPTPALSLLSSLPPTLDTRAITSLAKYLQGDTETAVADLEELLTELGDAGLEEGEDVEGRFVRGVVGTVWILEGEERREEGVEVLREAIELGKDQECLAILTHLYLSLSLPSHSSRLLSSPSTTSFTSDSLLSQILSAKTSLLTGPTDKYQQAYYVFEEIKGMQGGREGGAAGVAVSQALLGRWEESEQAVKEDLEAEKVDPTALANSISLALHLGKQSATSSSLEKLKQLSPAHPFLVKTNEMESRFEEAAAKFRVGAVVA